jgi:large subunit ribosomal protein L25
VAEVTLNAEVRTGRGKGAAHRLRAAGKVPGVLYGRGIESLALAVDARALSQTLSTEAGHNVLVDLHVDGATHLTLARELEKDPIRGTIKHVDFMRVDRNQAIVVDVPVHFEGDSQGIREGGVLEHHLWQLHVQTTPANVPDKITIDVSALSIGDSVHVSDVVPPPGVEILSPPEEIIVQCVVPQVLEVAPAEEAEAAEGEEAAAEGEAAEGEPAAESES